METLKELLDELEDVKRAFQQELSLVHDLPKVEDIRVRYLGRKGKVAQYFKKMGQVDACDRPEVGNRLNALKHALQEAVDSQSKSLTSNGKTVDSSFDWTLPGAMPETGHRNPLMSVMDEIKSIFIGMGFSVRTGPLIESEYYNFTALNFPKDHPAMDLQDTFYLPDGFLMRTHTSPVQIRTMENEKPPIRIIAPGRCFRKDAPDATHSPEFHQVEGLAVGEGISLAHLKGTLIAFAQRFFGEHTQVRFRPSFFPFTEPSAEMDVYFNERLGWLEILGSGMVDPNVLDNVGIDSEKYTGFAFGMGVERIAMLKYQVDDIRHFYDNDMRFLSQF